MSVIVSGSGKVLKHAKIVLVFWGAGWANSPAISAEEMAGVFSGILATPYMSKMGQYNGICNATIIRMALDTSKEFTEQYHNTPVFHQSELENMIAAHIEDGVVPGPGIDPDVFYMVVSEISVVCRETADEEAAGFHQSFTHGGSKVHYAWVSNSGSLTSGNMVPKTFVHELVEGCSDPEVDSFKRGSDGHEIGDLCEDQFRTMQNIKTLNAPGGIVVQPYFSDVDDACVLPTAYSVKSWGRFRNADLTKGLRPFLPAGGSLRSLLACGNTQPPAGFRISISQEENAFGGLLVVDGEQFTPAKSVFLGINHLPNKTVTITRFATVHPDGTFRYIEDFRCTSTNPADLATDVSITAIDTATGNLISATTSSRIFVCRPALN